jgi:lactate permease
MVAPAKISVGCTTTGMAGKEGEVLRVTLPYGLAIGAIVGAITFAMAVLG